MSTNQPTADAVIADVVAASKAPAPAPEPAPAPALAAPSDELLTIDSVNAHAWATFPVRVRPGAKVHCRKADVMTLVLQGVLPTEMIAAANTIEGMFDTIRQEGIGPFEAIMRMTPQERDEMMRLLHAFAVAVVVDPPLTMDPLGEPGKATVHGFNATELIAIFNAEPPKNLVATPPLNPPRMSAAQVRSFRAGERGSAADPVPSSNDVPSPTIELADDGVVELASR